MLIKTSKTRHRIGRTRSEQAENLRRVYGTSGGISDENLDKLKHLEKKHDIRIGFVPAHIVERVR